VAPITWGVVLTQIAAVFGVYLAANGRSLFVSHGSVHAAGAPSYASYVHEGFVEVSVAALLAVACVVVGHALVRTRGSVGTTPGGFGLATIECVLLGFVALALASSAHRLHLYEEAYGFTVLRLGVRFFQAAIAGLLTITAARCIARAWRGWGSALAWSALGLTTIVGSFDADGWVARRSVDMAQRGGHLDLAYLATLSDDALGALPEVTARGAEGGRGPRLLQAVWESAARTRALTRSGDWRAWRGLGSPRWVPILGGDLAQRLGGRDRCATLIRMPIMRDWDEVPAGAAPGPMAPSRPRAPDVGSASGTARPSLGPGRAPWLAPPARRGPVHAAFRGAAYEWLPA
jgi:hypothetical protein